MARKRGSLQEQASQQALGGRPSKKREVVPNLGRYKHGEIEDLRLRAYYPPTRKMYDVTDRLMSLTWADAVDQAAVQADLELANADGRIGELFNRPGMVFFVETKEFGHKFDERLRFIAFDTAVSTDTDVVSITGYDHLIYLQMARGSFTFKKDKDHKKGWRAHEIAIEICKEWGIPVATREGRERDKGKGKKKGGKAKGGKALQIVKTEFRIPYFNVDDVSLYEAIAKAYMIDRKKTKNHYYIEADRGRLVIRRRRNRRVILAITEDSGMRSASFSRTLSDRYGTIAEPRGTEKGGDGKHKGRGEDDNKHQAEGRDKKERDTETKKRGSKTAQDEKTRIASELLFGSLRYQPGIFSVRDPDWTKEAAQALVNKTSRARKSISLTANGNVHVKQGDRAFVRIPIGGGNLRRTVYVSSVSHNVLPGAYTMDLELAWTEREVDLDVELTDETDRNRDESAPDAGSEASDVQGMPPVKQGTYSRAELEELARAAGFPDPGYAAEIAIRESGGRPGVVAYAACGYGSDQNTWAWGLWQICVGAHQGQPIPRSGGRKVSQQTMIDPNLNALYAADLQKREGWGPWATA